MKTVSKLICTAGLGMMAATASAQVYSWNETSNPYSYIPDGDLNGTVITENVTVFGTTINTNAFRVNINIAGDPIGANGDLYGYLRSPDHTSTGGAGSVVAVLFNRVGVPSNSGLGYQDSGMNITFFDGSDPNGTHKDFHLYQDDPVYSLVQNGTTPVVTGVFKTDGRNINPLSSGTAFEAAGRTATLAGFQGIDPNGTWSLFLADVSSGGSSRLMSWGLDFSPIPEPHQYAMVIGAGLLAFALYRRRALKSA